MRPKVRRKILRRYKTDPILFGTRHSKICHEGRMADVSLRGSPVAIDPGDPVWIRKTPATGFPMNTDPSQTGIEATVCWCRKQPGNNDRPFSVGVSFTAAGFGS